MSASRGTARAIADKIGFTAITTQQDVAATIRKKCARSPKNSPTRIPKTVKAILKALHLSSVWIDKMENRKHMADVVSQATYINCPPDIILGRLLGKYDYGDGRKETGSRLHDLSRSANATSRRRRSACGGSASSAAGEWSSPRRIIRESSARCMRQDMYLDAMKDMGVTTKFKDMQKQTFFDGILRSGRSGEICAVISRSTAALRRRSGKCAARS